MVVKKRHCRPQNATVMIRVTTVQKVVVRGYSCGTVSNKKHPYKMAHIEVV